MGCPVEEGRIKEMSRSISQDLVMEEVHESKKAVAATKEVARPVRGGGGITAGCT